MSPTVLDRAPPRPSIVRSPPPQLTPVPNRPRDPRWIVPAGLIASALLHLVAFLLFRFEAETYGPAPAPRVSQPDGTRIVQVVALPDGVEPASPLPDREPPATAPRPTQPEPVGRVTETPPPAARDVGTLRDRIAPRAVDPRLRAAPDPLLPPVPSDAEIARGRLYARLGAYNDSTLIAAEAAARATDWTTTDANGNKWGVSPGKLHLGSLTLPLPISFSPPPGRRDELNGRVRNFNESEYQAGRWVGDNTLKDQIRAIRARKQAERDSTRRSGGR